MNAKKMHNEIIKSVEEMSMSHALKTRDLIIAWSKTGEGPFTRQELRVQKAVPLDIWMARTLDDEDRRAIIAESFKLEAMHNNVAYIYEDATIPEKAIMHCLRLFNGKRIVDFLEADGIQKTDEVFWDDTHDFNTALAAVFGFALVDYYESKKSASAS